MLTLALLVVAVGCLRVDYDVDGDKKADPVWYGTKDVDGQVVHGWFDGDAPTPLATLDDPPAYEAMTGAANTDSDPRPEFIALDSSQAGGPGEWITQPGDPTLAPVATCPPSGSGWNDVPLLGDWDGDGDDEPGRYCSDIATWILPGQAPIVFGRIEAEQIAAAATFGDDTDQVWEFAVTGDFDGDGDTDIAFSRVDGTVHVLGMANPVATGLPVGMALAGNFTGDRRDEVAVFDMTDGGWWIPGQGERPGPGTGTGTGVDLFFPGMAFYPLPAIGDYDGNGYLDLAVTGEDADGQIHFAIEGATDLVLDVVPNSWGDRQVQPVAFGVTAHVQLLASVFVTTNCNEGWGYYGCPVLP